jgi:hypothetical protein
MMARPLWVSEAHPQGVTNGWHAGAFAIVGSGFLGLAFRRSYMGIGRFK